MTGGMICLRNAKKEREVEMEKVKYLWGRYGTPRNIKVAYIVLALVALAVAGGAPGGTSGIPIGG
jgi:hypothetical protein